MTKYDESQPVNFGNSSSDNLQSEPVKFNDLGISSNSTNAIKNVIHSSNENSQTGGTDSPHNLGNNTNVEFDISQIFDLINKTGYHAKWERCFLCTCVNSSTGIPKSDCPICHGSGIAYLPATDLSITIQSQGKGVKYQDIGLMDSGSALGTVQVNQYVSFRDRISIPDQMLVQSYLFNMDDNRMKYGMRIPYSVAKFMLVKNSNNEDLVEGVDFSYNRDTHFFKPLSNKVYSGVNISMNILVELRYIVVDLLKQARYQYTQSEMPSGTAKFDRLPQYILLKREDAWIGNVSFTGTSTVDKTGIVDPKRSMDTNSTLKGFGF